MLRQQLLEDDRSDLGALRQFRNCFGLLLRAREAIGIADSISLSKFAQLVPLIASEHANPYK